MALGKIDHIDFTVEDLEKAEEYFTKKLGFKLLRRTYEGKAIELTSPAGDFSLDLRQGSEELYKAERERPGWPYHFYHIAFKVDDMNKELEELKSKGVSVGGGAPKFNPIEAPKFNPITGRTYANVPDADGRYWIQLSEAKKVG